MKHPEILIIGGGIVGLTLARRLSSEARVAIIDKGFAGREASWAAAGLLGVQHENFSPGPLFELSLESRRRYRSYVEDLEDETAFVLDYRTAGTIFPIFSAEEKVRCETRHAWQKKYGLAVDWLTASSCHRMLPALTREILGAYHLADDHQLNGRRLVDALIESVRRRGVAIHELTTAIRILTDNNNVIGVETPREVIRTPTVVLAAGSWSSGIPGIEIIKLPLIKPTRGQIITAQATHFKPFEHSIFSFHGYMIPKADGLILLGSTEENVGFDTTVTVGGMQSILTRALRLVPKIECCPIIDHWAGLRPESVDQWPILGPTPIDGLHLTTGHFRRGLLHAVMSAELVSRNILTKEVHPLLKPFMLDRFHPSFAEKPLVEVDRGC